jgi:hypothetical protein
VLPFLVQVSAVPMEMGTAILLDLVPALPERTYYGATNTSFSENAHKTDVISEATDDE